MLNIYMIQENKEQIHITSYSDFPTTRLIIFLQMTITRQLSDRDHQFPFYNKCGPNIA